MTQWARKHIELTGILQGVGCRPTVYRLAVSLGLAGWVMNTTAGVVIEIEGQPGQCSRFSEELIPSIPFPGRVETIDERDATPERELVFRIRQSEQGRLSLTPIPPDVAVCSECFNELYTPQNPRYLYPFITCTHCGPRFTVVRSFPYDRQRTSMDDFSMCERCLSEYSSPLDRRFHSQTNSCPDCGPRLFLTDHGGAPMKGDPLVRAVELLSQGRVLAIKGIGGFHLACDALNESAVELLRQRKGRAQKPFAVMMPHIDAVKEYCAPSEQETSILQSPSAPIVLLEASGKGLAPNVAPYVSTLGVLLPYSPIHHLLFRHPHAAVPAGVLKVLVMTSGNRSEEPIAAGNDEALERLGDLADAFLLHDREIALRADDSIVRVIGGRPTVFRRSRGLVPGGFPLPDFMASKRPHDDVWDQSRQEEGRVEHGVPPVVLGAGGDLKNCPAIIKDARLTPGPHVGDLASPVGQDYFNRSLGALMGYLEATPSVIAVDPHPEYFSSVLARQIPGRVVDVFHHHAHAVSLLLEHASEGPVIFAVFDGTGYGTDRAIWGGEFLVADLGSFKRVGRLSPISLPGGEAAIREPIRVLAALLAEDFKLPDRFKPLMGSYLPRVSLWLEASKKGLNSPATSSAGRLFDAVAAAAGFVEPVTFEGQAAMWLEGIAGRGEHGAYPVHIIRNDLLEVDTRILIGQVVQDILAGSPAEQVSARFHNTMAEIITRVAELLSAETGITQVGLTGGCFQNKLLTESTAALLASRKLKVLVHETVPPNDGGLAIGQAIAALAQARGGERAAYPRKNQD